MEQWKPLKRDPSIEVSNLGRLRMGTFLLPIKIAKGGYAFSKGVQGYSKFTKNHVLVMEQFGPERPHPKYRFIDHINGCRHDNQISNLRWVTPSLNNLNRRKVRGWCCDQKSGKYVSRITVEGERIELGVFETITEAFWAYRKAKSRVWEVWDDYNCYKYDAPKEAVDVQAVTACYDRTKVIESVMCDLKKHNFLLNKYMFHFPDNSWYSDFGYTKQESIEVIKSELAKQKQILDKFGKLPIELLETIQTFHKSKRPVLACGECRKRYYFLSDDSSAKGQMCMPCSVWWEKEANESP